MNDEPLDRDLERMSGSPELAHEIKQSLRRLSNGAAGPQLAEMARELLEGRTDLRTVAQSSAYANDLTGAIGQFQRWQSSQTQEERDQVVNEARRRPLAQDGPADE